jgi:hypothetical protein
LTLSTRLGQDPSFLSDFNDTLVPSGLSLEYESASLRDLMKLPTWVFILCWSRDFADKAIPHHLLQRPVESAGAEADSSVSGLLNRIGNAKTMLSVLGEGQQYVKYGGF